MFLSANLAATYAIANAPMRTWPFPHIYVEDVFPTETYRELISAMPSRDSFVRIDKTGAVAPGYYKERFVYSFGQQSSGVSLNSVWDHIAKSLLAPEFFAALLKKFSDYLPDGLQETDAGEFGRQLRLVRDYTDYALPPHTDSRNELIALLFYLPDDSGLEHCGTSMYIPKDPSMFDGGAAHHLRSEFDLVGTAPYRPNSLFGFIRGDFSYHGVERFSVSGGERRLLLFNSYIPRSARELSSPPLPRERKRGIVERLIKGKA
jgi:hypothetical protein